MRIIVNHLTRMTRDSRICVAGLEVDTLDQVRPVTPRNDPITRSLLRENGGPFAVGALVDIGATTPNPNPPEIEDHGFRTGNARLIEMLSPERYWETLDEVQVASLEDAFGPDLDSEGRGLAIESGHGTRSLAVIPVAGHPQLDIDDWGKLRLHLPHHDTTVAPSVTDVRLVEPDHSTIRRDAVTDVNARLRNGVDTYAMVGLSRAFPKTGNLHWVQINGLCLADSPLGDSP